VGGCPPPPSPPTAPPPPIPPPPSPPPPRIFPANYTCPFVCSDLIPAPCPCYYTLCAGEAITYGKVNPRCTKAIMIYCGMGAADLACKPFVERKTKIETVKRGVAIKFEEGTPSFTRADGMNMSTTLDIAAGAFTSDVEVSVGEAADESEIAAVRPGRLNALKSTLIVLQPHGGAEQVECRVPTACMQLIHSAW
jgi:hypothetical protein